MREQGGWLSQRLQAPDPVIVGVLNITPDSFSDGGDFLAPADALAQAEALAADGADIIEIGGEATSPGAAPLSATEELQRIRETVQLLARRFTLSVDTYHAQTAAFALAEGVSIINDVSALRADSQLAPLLAGSTCSVVVCYNRFPTLPHVNESAFDYDDVVQRVLSFFRERIAWCRSAGISPERLVVDPALGRFVSHDAKYSWELLRSLRVLVDAMPCPVMLGASRKGFLGGSLDERDPTSAMVAAYGVQQGVRLIRTHNPRMTRDALRVAGELRRIGDGTKGRLL